jgi:glycosyltransferase involved in cell wall biosynthesis
MHLGLDLLFLDPGRSGGRETYARELLAAMREQRGDLRVTAFVSVLASGDGFWRDLADSTVVLGAASPNSALRWALSELAALPRVAARHEIDVLHSPANLAPLTGPFARVVTLHDLIFRRLPSTVPNVQRWGTEAIVPAVARRADRIITVSAASRDDILAELRVSPDQIDVVPNGVAPAGHGDADAARERLRLGTRQLALSVATAVAHKNLPGLLGALALIPASRRPVLAFAGHGTTAGDLLERARALGVDDDVRLLGAVDPAALEDLYAAADVLVTATRYEGFGLPVIEAMARGIPVACSNLPVLREVAGDAALMFEPTMPGAIAAAMNDVLVGGPAVQERIALGRERAALFTWAAAAEGTLAAYERAWASARDRSHCARR